MNESTDIRHVEASPFRTIVTDDGVQRAAAGIVVAFVVSVAKHLIFGATAPRA